MFRSLVFATAIGISTVSAQQTLSVDVGANGILSYDPPTVNASVGDLVRFVFHQKNHTLTQSSFDNPCTTLTGGIDSGFMFVADDAAALPTFAVNISDSSIPIYFHCKQPVGNHCGNGMVFAINDQGTFDAYQTAANATLNAGTTAAMYSTPPPPTFETATVTVTVGASVWTTTYSSYPGSAPPTPAAAPVDHQVTVGADGLFRYNPQNITALPNDTVTFKFEPKNHTVTQSSFSQPCTHLDGGFTSGFMPVDNTSVTPEFTITINDTSPVWVYCGQTGHCGQGMVFSVNALEDGGGHSFEDFQRLANNSASVAAVSAAQSNDSPPGGGGSDSGTNAASPSARVPFITVGLAILFVVML